MNETVQRLKRQRDDRAAKFRKLRKFDLAEVPRHEHRYIIYGLYGRARIIRPVARELYQYAIDCLRFSRTTWTNPLDTETYSACGYDDMQSDARYQARVEALKFFRAWKAVLAEHA